MSEDQKAINVQLEMRNLANKLESVEKFSDEYWEISDRKDELHEQYLELRKMAEEEIKSEDEVTERNRDID